MAVRVVMAGVGGMAGAISLGPKDLKGLKGLKEVAGEAVVRSTLEEDGDEERRQLLLL